MSEPTRYSFELREVAEALVKKQKLQKGKWTIGFEFGLGAGNFGPTPESSKPSAIIQITKVHLVAHPSDGPALEFTIDAEAKAEAQPQPKRKTRIAKAK